MLNISKTELVKRLDLDEFDSGKRVLHRTHFEYFNRFLIGFAIIMIIVLFLPWTQTVTGNGFVTTLTPDQRPQTIQSPIPGRLETWFVREGDRVFKGDTILQISEVKSEYFDPELVNRTDLQIDAKEQSVESYDFKIQSLRQQTVALQSELQLKLNQAANKLEQAKLKVVSDSIDLEAARTNQTIAERQLERTATLEDEGLKSQVDVEQKRLKLQETQAKLISQRQKLLQSKNEVTNAQIEISRTRQEYAEKIAKTRSDLGSAQSDQLDVAVQVSKLQSDRANYSMRNDLYFITAPQDGFINKAIKSGLGETFKEGEPLVNIMPSNYDLAVETFVEPIDLPLLHKGEHVRVQFDGWPAIVFSGWPNASVGTYGAEIVAVETFTSSNGKYRVLLAPDNIDDESWPEALRPGAGAYTIALLEDVPVWYEIWRQLNGFPPDYYTPESDSKDDKKK
ncbi:HlyD family secretion protein [Nonlabens ponticola]|uniref:HlyD family efflux transporter periplasmic adaptor subunit n=1 Tax=Nonlabens ponticola TaxID=2496866 RepID=A0A3S9MXB5_9FLAO|nr:biotin/lipoyl-binding protein [Nonlabens ponticola]AZQ43916.1 HlyD family efflux transporter periplasmic adaptor subunit [Nonlabens ponticola]